eukprot:RCo050854
MTAFGEALDILKREWEELHYSLPASFVLRDRHRPKAFTPVTELLNQSAAGESSTAGKKVSSKLEKEHVMNPEAAEPTESASGVRQRLKKLVPVIPYLETLQHPASQVREAAALNLYKHLQQNSSHFRGGLDPEDNAVSYVLTRLVSSCGTKKPAALLGCSFALSLILRLETNISTRTILNLCKKEIRPSKKDEKMEFSYLWGKSFVYAALIVADRIVQVGDIEEVTKFMVNTCEQTFAAPFLCTCIGYLIRKLPRRQLLAVVYPQIRWLFPESSLEYTAEALYLTLALQAAFQGSLESVESPKLKSILKAKVFSQSFMTIVGPSVALGAGRCRPQLHIVWAPFLKAMFDSRKDLKVLERFRNFWQCFFIGPISQGQSPTLLSSALSNVLEKVLPFVIAVRDEAVRNEMFYILYQIYPDWFERLSLVPRKGELILSIGTLIRQFWQLSQLKESKLKDENIVWVDPKAEREFGADLWRHCFFRRSSRPDLERFLLNARCKLLACLKAHAMARREALPQVLEFTMNQALFFAKSDDKPTPDVKPAAIPRENDLSPHAVVVCFDTMLILLARVVTQSPMGVAAFLRALREGERTHGTRYAPLAPD